MSSVAVVGAGISGLACARELRAAGIPVTVFEKSRGVGGRMSTRREDGGLEFDHGAQYFTVRDPDFATAVDEWQSAGTVRQWSGRFASLTRGAVEWKGDSPIRYVGVPGMNAACHHLARGLDVRLRQRITALAHGPDWELSDEAGKIDGSFAAVVLSLPAPQSVALLGAAPELRSEIENVDLDGCWAVMLGFDEPLDVPFDGAFVQESPLSWIARNRSKPGRDGAETWILHGSPTWTRARLEADPAIVLESLTEAFWDACAILPVRPRHDVAHLWRYAIPSEPLADRSFLDGMRAIGCCGDWCGGPRVEGAYLSGLQLGRRLVAYLR